MEQEQQPSEEGPEQWSQCATYLGQGEWDLVTEDKKAMQATEEIQEMTLGRESRQKLRIVI